MNSCKVFSSLGQHPCDARFYENFFHFNNRHKTIVFFIKCFMQTYNESMNLYCFKTKELLLKQMFIDFCAQTIAALPIARHSFAPREPWPCWVQTSFASQASWPLSSAFPQARGGSTLCLANSDPFFRRFSGLGRPIRCAIFPLTSASSFVATSTVILGGSSVHLGAHTLQPPSAPCARTTALDARPCH
jgi:hypothetical protein